MEGENQRTPSQGWAAMTSSFHAPRKPSCPSWGDVSLFPCGKQRREGCKLAAFLERGPIPLGKQPSNRCLRRVVRCGCVGRESTQQSVTFAMAEVQGQWHAGGCSMRAFPKVCRCFVPWRSSSMLQQLRVWWCLGQGVARQQMPVHACCCLALLIC